MVNCNGIAERHWKVTVSSLFPNDQRIESVYEGLHAHGNAACDAALFKEARENGGATIPTIVKIEEVAKATVAVSSSCIA